MTNEKEEIKKTSTYSPRERKIFKMVECDDWEYGFRVFPVTDETRELLKEIPTVPLSKASDLEEGDEVIVSFLKDDRTIYGIGEITSVDYVGKIPFTIFMTKHSSAPDESFKIHKEYIKHKIVRRKENE